MAEDMLRILDMEEAILKLLVKVDRQPAGILTKSDRP